MILTPDDIQAHLAAGRTALRDAATPLRLWPAFREGRATQPQRRRAVLRLIGQAGTTLADLARSFADRLPRGLTTLAAWARSSWATIAAGHFAAMMAGTGGTDPSPADVAEAAKAVERQGRYFDGFRGDIASGRVAVWSPTIGGPAIKPAKPRQAAPGFLARIGLYPHAFWATAENTAGARMRRDGYTRERWVLDGGERHCEGCPALASLGWVAIGTLPDIGSQPCRSRCRCSKAYSHGSAGDKAGPMAA